MVAGSRDKRRDDIAIPVAEGNDLIALDLLMPVEADVVAPFLRRRGRTIAMDDGHVEKVGLTKPQYHGRASAPRAESRMKTTTLPVVYQQLPSSPMLAARTGSDANPIRPVMPTS